MEDFWRDKSDRTALCYNTDLNMTEHTVLHWLAISLVTLS